VAVAIDDPLERERRDIGLAIVHENETGLGRADLRNCGSDRARQRGAAGDGGLHHRGARRYGIDQIGIHK
jgi:hypothetical protein